MTEMTRLNKENRVRAPRVFRRLAVTALAATVLAGVATPGAVAAGSQKRPELQAAIQEAVDSGFAGIQLRVHDERGEWAGSAGVRKLGASAKPPTNGRFWIGSTTKPFTATLVLQLVADGKIGMDAPVARYVPELGVDPRITVRMLLQHTSGLFNYTGEYYDDGTFVPGIPATGKDWVDNRFRSYRPEELVRLALSKGARFEPGTDHYSNTNYTLALLLIERVTGRSYAEELRRRILRPLGLRNTLVPGNRTQLPGPHAHGYYRYQVNGEWKITDVTRQNLSLLTGAGDMISTTQDLHTFISALMSGKLLPASLLAEMRTPQGTYGYGLGLFIQDTGAACSGPIVHHNGSPPGGYGSLMLSTLDGRKTLTASLTTGDSPANPTETYQKALTLLINKVFCTGQAAD